MSHEVVDGAGKCDGRKDAQSAYVSIKVAVFAFKSSFATRRC
jgi:hypothetical protein